MEIFCVWWSNRFWLASRAKFLAAFLDSPDKKKENLWCLGFLIQKKSFEAFCQMKKKVLRVSRLAKKGSLFLFLPDFSTEKRLTPLLLGGPRKGEAKCKVIASGSTLILFSASVAKKKFSLRKGVKTSSVWPCSNLETRAFKPTTKKLFPLKLLSANEKVFFFSSFLPFSTRASLFGLCGAAFDSQENLLFPTFFSLLWSRWGCCCLAKWIDHNSCQGRGRDVNRVIRVGQTQLLFISLLVLGGQHRPIEMTVFRVPRGKVVVRVIVVQVGGGGADAGAALEGGQLLAPEVPGRGPVHDLVAVGSVLLVADAAQEEAAGHGRGRRVRG